MILLAIIKKSISQERCPMRVSLTRQDNPEGDPDIVVHGARPQRTKAPSCGTCTKRFNCIILNYSLASMQVLMPMPTKPTQVILDKNGRPVESQDAFFPFPMPCKGEAYSPNTNVDFENNPLVQRLGLVNVADPVAYYDHERKDKDNE